MQESPLLIITVATRSHGGQHHLHICWQEPFGKAVLLISAPCDSVLPAKGYSSNMSVCAMMQMGACIEGSLGTAKRPLGDCLEGLVQMLSPLFVQRTYAAGSFLVKQVYPSICLSVCVRDHVFLSCSSQASTLPALSMFVISKWFDCRP